MRITGKTFRRRRADSESEEDEQESEEVRYVCGRARKRETVLGLDASRHRADTIDREAGFLPFRGFWG